MSTCPALSVGGGHYTTCQLEKGHTGSHKDRPWQPVTKPAEGAARV